jgi:hypothetical protein
MLPRLFITSKPTYHSQTCRFTALYIEKNPAGTMNAGNRANWNRSIFWSAAPAAYYKDTARSAMPKEKQTTP